jgi:hypothetical protein
MIWSSMHGNVCWAWCTQVRWALELLMFSHSFTPVHDVCVPVMYVCKLAFMHTHIHAHAHVRSVCPYVCVSVADSDVAECRDFGCTGVCHVHCMLVPSMDFCTFMFITLVDSYGCAHLKGFVIFYNCMCAWLSPQTSCCFARVYAYVGRCKCIVWLQWLSSGCTHAPEYVVLRDSCKYAA